MSKTTLVSEIIKHLAGQHDQKRHAGQVTQITNDPLAGLMTSYTKQGAREVRQAWDRMCNTSIEETINDINSIKINSTNGETVRPYVAQIEHRPYLSSRDVTQDDLKLKIHIGGCRITYSQADHLLSNVIHGSAIQLDEIENTDIDGPLFTEFIKKIEPIIKETGAASLILNPSEVSLDAVNEMGGFRVYDLNEDINGNDNWLHPSNLSNILEKYADVAGEYSKHFDVDFNKAGSLGSHPLLSDIIDIPLILPYLTDAPSVMDDRSDSRLKLIKVF